MRRERTSSQSGTRRGGCHVALTAAHHRADPGRVPRRACRSAGRSHAAPDGANRYTWVRLSAMLRWLFRGHLLRSAIRDVRVLRTMPPSAQIKIARELAYRMARVEHTVQDHGVPASVKAAEEMRITATADRQLAVSRGARNFDDDAWLLASLSETWASARLESGGSRWAGRNFQRIDKLMVYGCIEALGEDEIRRIAKR